MKTNIYNKVVVGVSSFLIPLSSFLFTSCKDSFLEQVPCLLLRRHGLFFCLHRFGSLISEVRGNGHDQRCREHSQYRRYQYYAGCPSG